MTVKQIAKIVGSQDGAIFGKHLFRFDSHGVGRVYDLSDLEQSFEVKDISPFATFTLDKANIIVPHSNAMFFGTEYFEDGDEFPLLYSNIYNNYAKAEDKKPGMLTVYRIRRCEVGFTSELVQLIKVGFTDDTDLWRSSGDVSDARPYGNFVMDTAENKLYAFVMRDATKTTRYFAFDMPRLTDGECDPELGVRCVTLGKEDIINYFDTPYHRFIQGACMKDGLIYSTEGFGKSIHPAIRIIDVKKREQIFFFDFYEAGFEVEAEFIDFLGDKCLYSDAHGNVFQLIFD